MRHKLFNYTKLLVKLYEFGLKLVFVKILMIKLHLKIFSLRTVLIDIAKFTESKIEMFKKRSFCCE